MPHYLPPLLSLLLAVAPPPQAGPDGKSIIIAEAYWYDGSVSGSQGFLTGEVTEVASEVQTSPQETSLAERCTVRVDSVFGSFKELEGIGTVVLANSQEQSPYVPVEAGWGGLRHLQQGQRVLVLLHEYEGQPVFGAEAVAVLTEKTRSLPEILRRTAFQPARFTREDLAVVKWAMPALHQHLAEVRAWEKSLPDDNEERPRFSTGLVVTAALTAAGVVLFLGWSQSRPPSPRR